MHDSKRRRARITPGALFTVWLLIGLSACTGLPSKPAPSGLSDRQFEALLERLAEAWNANDAALAASLFSVDAVYSEPPDRQLYVGREALYQFFGGEQGRSSWMRMDWHHISFNQRRQTGAGEFTFAWPGGQVHGMVSIRIEAGLISRWREYFHESDLNWDAFHKDSAF